MACVNGLLRVGGRLSNSVQPEEVKHPILLPKHHHISLTILEHEHRIHFHPGTFRHRSPTILDCLHMIVINVFANATKQLINIWRTRQLFGYVKHVKAFENTGLDYAGPLILKVHKGRNQRNKKGYICLLELDTYLTTETFLAALRRFISRQGKCTQIFTDNGCNFVGAKKLLDDMFKLILSARVSN